MSLAFQTEEGTIYLENLYSVFNNQDCVLYKENFHQRFFTDLALADILRAFIFGIVQRELHILGSVGPISKLKIVTKHQSLAHFPT